MQRIRYECRGNAVQRTELQVRMSNANTDSKAALACHRQPIRLTAPHGGTTRETPRRRPNAITTLRVHARRDATKGEERREEAMNRDERKQRNTRKKEGDETRTQRARSTYVPCLCLRVPLFTYHLCTTNLRGYPDIARKRARREREK